MSFSIRISRETEPSFCTNCYTSFDSARALRNHRRNCRVPILNEDQDVEMEEQPPVETTLIQPQSPPSALVTANSDHANQLHDDDAMSDIEEMIPAADDADYDYAGFEQTPGAADLLPIVDNNGDNPEEPGLEFDLLNVKYKTVGVVDPDAEDQACFYDCRSLEDINQNTYTTTELVSIELYDIVNDFAIPRDAYRKLVRLMNTVLRDTEKISRESNPEIMHGPRVQSMLQRQSSLTSHEYDVCINGCKLYALEVDDEETICNICSHERYDARGDHRALSTMKVMSIGDIVSRLVANSITREELRYRHAYDNRDLEENPSDVIIADVFDGATYKSIKNTHFTNDLDIAVAIMNDGFVVEKRGDRLFTIIHLMVFNYDPHKRYKEEYTHELCIFPGKKKPKSFDSFISIILAELQWLSTYGMVVETNDAGPIRLKVHPLICGGDTPAVFDWSKCAHHASEYGCRWCLSRGMHPDNRSHGMYFPNAGSMRTNEDYERAESNLGFNGVSLFNQLSSCIAPQCFGFEEMHTLARGVGSELFEMLTVDRSPNNTKFFYTYPDGELERENYPFFIPKQRLFEIGKAIEDTRSYIPVAFDGSFLNLVEKLRGTRSVDYLDNLLTIIPTLFVPELASPQARKAIMKLVRGVCLALQWEFTESRLAEIDECIDFFIDYCKTQRDAMCLSLSVFRPVMHQLTHVVWMIREMGPIVAYSSRSQERSIGKFGDLITGKSRRGKQSSNLIEIVAIRNQLKRIFDSNEFLQGIRPQPYASTTYLNHPESLTSSQLWEPNQEETNLDHHFGFDGTDRAELHGVPIARFKRALSKYYCRIFSLQRLNSPLSMTIKVAHRALIGSTVIGSEIYREKMHEFRRSNHLVMFRSTHLNRLNHPVSCWFVSRVIFFFQHVYDGSTYFLAFVETMKNHGVASHDRSVPFVRMNEPVEQQIARRVPRVIDPKYAVISIDDVEMQVGLVKSLDNDLHFSVIANYHAFEQDMSIDAGDIRNL
ncbi:uncharacterized protein ATC70_007466 [Mucor velutinosus]|uniref:Uncharacterized protein n=1 Tax=Mucor velutinosus TaxID=708070 RepID=A0AAN7D259_9FUNG|nr:hypothetical protein ATC70_007466 [Mucor velutinosus]